MSIGIAEMQLPSPCSTESATDTSLAAESFGSAEKLFQVSATKSHLFGIRDFRRSGLRNLNDHFRAGYKGNPLQLELPLLADGR